MIEKYNLINSITPLYKMNYSYENTNIWIKRDDLIDFALGGNKVRLFEYIIPQIIRNGAHKVATYGSKHSNYLRVAATVCSLLNLECDLIVLDGENNTAAQIGPNLRLIKDLPVRILYSRLSDANSFIDEYQDNLKRKGIEYTWIPGGGHIPEASFGYVDAAREIREQLFALHLDIDALFLPCGTGTTQSGLIFGFNNSTKIIGISISRPVERCVHVITDTINEMQALCETNSTDHPDIQVFQDDLEYGIITPEITDIIKTIAMSDGIFLDPIYNARAFIGMLRFLKNNPSMKNVLFLNTGGQPNLFQEERAL